MHNQFQGNFRIEGQTNQNQTDRQTKMHRTPPARGPINTRFNLLKPVGEPNVIK